MTQTSQATRAGPEMIPQTGAIAYEPAIHPYPVVRNENFILKDSPDFIILQHIQYEWP
jgi:hypothetical protein